MKKTVLRYGLFSTLIIVAFFLIKWLFTKNEENPDYNTQEILGYAGIILSLLFVFAGIKYYRDRVNNGVISFGKALKVGLLICLLPAIAFGLFNVIYILLDPGFMDKYYSFKLAELKNLPAAEYAAEVKNIEDIRAKFGSPAVQFGVMFLSVYLIGVVVSILSALILKKKSAIVAA